MSSKLSELHRKLMSEWSKEKTRKLDEIDNLITSLKTEFLITESLTGLPEEQLIKIQRDLLETEVLYLAVQGDIPGFQESMIKLKQFYEDWSQRYTVDKVFRPTYSMTESPLKTLMLGLDLMCLLAQNQLAQFHMELERMHSLTDNIYISTPVKLEQYLMQGSYNKVFMTEKNVPSPYYKPFVKILLDTVRDEIGSCIEKSYQELGVMDAARLLFLVGAKAKEETLTYANKRKWKLTGDKFVFFSSIEKTAHEAQQLDVQGLAKKNIFYAKQLEMIV